MATRTITQLIDDIDGRNLQPDNADTVRFSLDGAHYEIDLSKRNAAKLRSVLADYIAAGRKTTPKGKVARKTPLAPTSKELRDWARTNGVEVPDRGQIPKTVREAYAAAH